jgi:hypothetical protein
MKWQESKTTVAAFQGVVDALFRAFSADSITMAFFLHIDEFQIAHLACKSRGPRDFVKRMLQSIGNYRCDSMGRKKKPPRSDAVAGKVFLVPFLTGTSPEGAGLFFLRA